MWFNSAFKGLNSEDISLFQDVRKQKIVTAVLYCESFNAFNIKLCIDVIAYWHYVFYLLRMTKLYNNAV